MSEAHLPPTSGSYTSPRPAERAAGSWATYEPPASARSSYRPTTEQLARDEARRRYLRRNVYVPILITVVIIVVLFLGIVALAFGAGARLGIDTSEVASFIAGLAALIVILFSIPLTIAMSILPITWVALRLNRRRQRKLYPETGPMAYRSRVQTLLWQLDSLLIGAESGVERFAVRLRRPLIKLHARAAYLRGWLRGIQDQFTRSNQNGNG